MYILYVHTVWSRIDSMFPKKRYVLNFIEPVRVIREHHMKICYSGWWNIFKSAICAHKLSRNVSSTVVTFSIGLYHVMKGEGSLLNPLGVFVHIWSISFALSTRQTWFYRSVHKSSILFRIFNITKLIGFWKFRFNLTVSIFNWPWRKFWLYVVHFDFESTNQVFGFSSKIFLKLKSLPFSLPTPASFTTVAMSAWPFHTNYGPSWNDFGNPPIHTEIFTLSIKVV